MKPYKIVLIAFAWFACVTINALPEPSESDLVHAPEGATMESLRAGRKLYEAKCGGCHRLFAPGERASTQWPAIVKSMQGLFDLSEEESRFILEYLKTFGAE
jgi:mono/diheme cytochrome c family protein